MDSSIQDVFSITLDRLSREEADLEARAGEINARLSGLKDLTLLLSLAKAKLSLCLHVMDKIAASPVPSSGPNGPERSAHSDAGGRDLEHLKAMVRDKALSAFGIIEGLFSENVSEDQKGEVAKDPLFPPLKETLERFMMMGGGGFLEAEELDGKQNRALSRGIVASMRKFSEDADLYVPMELENYPPFVRRILLTFFPVFSKEHPEKPPYGIEEGEEETISSRKMKLPISQAIFYMENELVPHLVRQLEESPGDGTLQKEIEGTKRQIEEYKKLRFFPRSVPVLLDPGYYTDGLTSYTADGEMLVPIPVAVTLRSGTNLDRKMELVRMDLVKRLAGRGVCPELDREYERLKSLGSGMRGSSRAASLKLDAAWGFTVLKKNFPVLSRLEDKEAFKELEDLASRGSAGSSARRLSALLQTAQSDRSGLPILIKISRTDPS